MFLNFNPYMQTSLFITIKINWKFSIDKSDKANFKTFETKYNCVSK